MMGEVKTPSVQEAEALKGYLEKNALQAAQQQPRGPEAAAFTSHCGGFHALPDAAQH